MARVRKINPDEFKNEVERYIVANKSDIRAIAKKAALDEGTIYNLLKNGKGFGTTIKKLERIGFVFREQKMLK